MRAPAAGNDGATVAGDGTPISRTGDSATVRQRGRVRRQHAGVGTRHDRGLQPRRARGWQQRSAAADNDGASAADDGTSMPGPGDSVLTSEETALTSGLGAIALTPDKRILTSGFSGRTLMSEVCFSEMQRRSESVCIVCGLSHFHV